jgi:transcription initiation factor IIE alpha subunit
LTVYAESLITTVARAFYDDEAIALIDVLIRDKFLRDDDMSIRLNIPAKKLRSTLQYLMEERWVDVETVDDLAQGGSQATKFYYIDYCRTVHTIRLRLHLLQQQLEAAEIAARSNSYYVCPGYKSRRCNGKYTEEDVQQYVDLSTGLFICWECQQLFANHPNAPDIRDYTLQLIDNAQDLRLARDQLRRFNVQMSAKFIGNVQLRSGIYDLLQKVRGTGTGTGSTGTGGGKNTTTTPSFMMKSNHFHQNNNNISKSSITINNSNISNNVHTTNNHNVVTRLTPITSNLPSENFALGIGSKRLAGTGRTAGIKAKKLEQQGVAESVAHARSYLVGGAGGGGSTNNSKSSSNANSTATTIVVNNRATNNNNNYTGRHGTTATTTTATTWGEVMFLKNALGSEVYFAVEKGGGTRAQLLATRHSRRLKLIEAAACRVGVSIPIYIQVAAADARYRHEQITSRRLQRQRKQQKLQQQQQQAVINGEGQGDINDNKNNNNNNNSKNKTKQIQKPGESFSFLEDNIGRGVVDIVTDDDEDDDMDVDQGTYENEPFDMMNTYHDRNYTFKMFRHEPELLVLSDTLQDEIAKDKIPYDQRLATFQAQYKVEHARQIKYIRDDETAANTSSNANRPANVSFHNNELGQEPDQWEDG